MPPTHTLKSEKGMALILVTFLVALASIIVLNLTYSTFISARMSSMVERSLQAEYMLKSAVNFARVMIREDLTPEDGVQDFWGKFSNGAAVPLDLLGIKQPNTSIELEIRPEESKFPIRSILPINGGDADKNWRGALARLFRDLGFDDDSQEVDHTGHFPNRHFNSEELVSILIDYMDQDKDSYDPDDFSKGIESDLPEGTFPNARLGRVGELKAIPGFTPNRMRKLEPLITVFGVGVVNINLAPSSVLKALSEDISDTNIEAIIEFRKSPEGPFTFENRKEKLENIIGATIYDKIGPMTTVEGKWFQVLAKVDYQISTYFMRAFISRDKAGSLPVIRSLELF